MFRFLGILCGVVAFVLLAWNGFQIDFQSRLSTVLQSYDKHLHEIVSDVDAVGKEIIALANANLGSSLELHPHWIYVFALMWLYFGAVAGSAWQSRNLGTSVFIALYGLVIALTASVLAGTIPTSSMPFSLLIPSVALVGHIVFGLGQAAWRAVFINRLPASVRRNIEVLKKAGGVFYDGRPTFAQVMGSALREFVARHGIAGASVLVLVAAVPDPPIVSSLPNPGIAVLAILLLALLLRHVWLGVARAQEIREQKESWWSVLRRTAELKIAQNMIWTLVAAAGFVSIGIALA